jgi:AraC-like DNA-binding protein
VSVVFRASDAAVDAREDYWRQVHHDHFGPLDLVPEAQLGADDRLVVGELGPVRVAVLTSGPGQVRRTARDVGQVDPDRGLLIVQDEGSARVGHGGSLAELKPGDLDLVDLALPFRCFHSADRTVMLTFPLSLLPLRRPEISRLAGARIPGDGGAPALVSTLIRELPGHLDDPGVAGARLGTAVLDLLTVALTARLGRPLRAARAADRRALRDRVRTYIEVRLPAADLSPATVAAAHHISVRYLHQLFDDEEYSVAAYIRRRRLERCRTDLLDPSLAGRPVGAVAARWGFANAAHFSRLFRDVYGLPPGEYRQGNTATTRAHDPQRR